ncbi:MAG: hypothetical protein CMI01_18415 [Oceanospirillaceae bacterium]|nr:hypothetical protein [Oceanospirillaceae bacterium]
MTLRDSLAPKEKPTPCGNRGFAEKPASRGIQAAEDLRINCGKGVLFDTDALPLAQKEPELQFPVSALGVRLAPVVKRIAHYVQVSEGMAAQCTLSAVSLVAQGQYNVGRGGYGISPLSLFMLTIAESGERKSTVDKVVMKPVRDFEAELMDQFGLEWAKYKSEKAAWDKQVSSVEKHYSNQKGPLSQESAARMAAERYDLERQEPRPPLRPNITMSEPTSEGVFRHLAEGRPSAGIFTAEGGNFYCGHGMSDESRGRMVTMTSDIWDGNPVTRTRGAAGESSVLRGVRVTIHIMIQPVIADDVLGDPFLINQGFLPRHLIYRAPTKAGTRFLSNRPVDEDPSEDPVIQAYWGRLAEMLDRELVTDPASGALELETLEIRGDAWLQWRKLFDGIEAESGPKGRYWEIRAFASKAAENAARIAGVLAAFDGTGITVEHITNAGHLIGFYLESMLTNVEQAQQDQRLVEANDLLEWLRESGGSIDAHQFKKLPSKYRSAKKARHLLYVLAEHGHVRVTKTSIHNGKPSAWEVVHRD